MADPLDALRAPLTPVAPDPAFAARLRSRLAAALGLGPGGGSTMTDTATTGATAHAPPALPTLVPYICVHDTRAALEWYAEVFGARRRGEVIVMDDGRVGHAELELGNSVLMLADEFPEIGVVSPRSQEDSSTSFTLQVPDVDATYALAIARGARGERPPADQFYGARAAWLVDPFGHRWSVQTPLPEGAAPPAPPPGVVDAS